MKAIRVFPRRPTLVALMLISLGAACTQQEAPAPPAPAPRATPIAPRPAPRADWRTIALAPGDWSWSAANGQSEARFAGGRVVLRCDRRTATVTLAVVSTANAPAPITIHTSTANFTRNAEPAAGGSASLEARLPARDPALDAMAFSRGRFALDAPGADELAVPSWSEIGRVIEDCR